MSDATETSRNALAAEVAAERFGSAAPEAGHRLRVIAALHAIAAFFTDHPHVPVPVTVQLHAPVPDHAALEALANAFGTTIYGDRPQVSIGIDPPDLYATVLAYVPGAERPL
jgi:hypothetical protein